MIPGIIGLLIGAVIGFFFGYAHSVSASLSGAFLNAAAQLLEKRDATIAQVNAVLRQQLKPDGISDHEALNRLHEIMDATHKNGN